MNTPNGVALDSNGDLFVADTGNNRVQEYLFNPATGTYASAATTVAGVGGAGSGATQLNAAEQVVLDAKGDLFVLDTGNSRVQEYLFNSATGTYASAATTAAAALPASVSIPQGIALDANGDLFVSGEYLGDGAVLEYAYNPTTGTFASAGVSVVPGAMVGPTGIAFDSHGNLFASETAHTSDPGQTVWNTVVEFSYTASTGTFAPVDTVMGQVGRVNDGITALAVDAQGNLFVSDTVNGTGVNEFHVNASTGAYSSRRLHRCGIQWIGRGQRR